MFHRKINKLLDYVTSDKIAVGIDKHIIQQFKHGGKFLPFLSVYGDTFAEAIQKAFGTVDYKNAKAILVYYHLNQSTTPTDIDTAMEIIRSNTDENCNILFALDNNRPEGVRVQIVATRKH